VGKQPPLSLVGHNGHFFYEKISRKNFSLFFLSPFWSVVHERGGPLQPVQVSVLLLDFESDKFSLAESSCEAASMVTLLLKCGVPPSPLS